MLIDFFFLNFAYNCEKHAAKSNRSIFFLDEFRFFWIFTKVVWMGFHITSKNIINSG